MKFGIPFQHTVEFEITKHSPVRGTSETIKTKNVVLDVGFDWWLRAQIDNTIANRFMPDFLFLGTGTTEPDRSDTGLTAVSTTAPPKYRTAQQQGGEYIENELCIAETKFTFGWGEGEAEGTWTELGLAFWDGIGSNAQTRGGLNTYTTPYSKSLVRKGILSDDGTASAGGASTLTDGTKTWPVDEWKDNYTIEIIGGTGVGQSREITGNTSDTITVNAPWDVQPDATSQYRIKGTPFSVTVLSDEFFTVVAYFRIKVPVSLSGSFTFDGELINWTMFTQSISAGQWAGNITNNRLLADSNRFRVNHVPTNTTTNAVNAFPSEFTKDVPNVSIQAKWNVDPRSDTRRYRWLSWSASSGAGINFRFDFSPWFVVEEGDRLLSDWWTFQIYRAD